MANTEEYYLWVSNAGFAQGGWFTAAAANCAAGVGTCAVTPGFALQAGLVRWEVKPWNTPYGHGPWSADGWFTLAGESPLALESQAALARTTVSSAVGAGLAIGAVQSATGQRTAAARGDDARSIGFTPPGTSQALSDTRPAAAMSRSQAGGAQAHAASTSEFTVHAEVPAGPPFLPLGIQHRPGIRAASDPVVESDGEVVEGTGPSSPSGHAEGRPASTAAAPPPPPPASEVVECYHLDALGSVRLVTDEAGAVLRYHDYLPFGEEWQPQTPAKDLRLFTGKERDFETGLDYFGARYYRADLGTFTTVDPAQNVAEALTDPQRWNRYAYARNNPLRYVDPDGEDIQEYRLLISGSNQVPKAPHPEVRDATMLGPKQTPTGGYFLLNTQAVFDERDNPADYKAQRTAYILHTGTPIVRTGAEEDPDKSQVANVGNSQFVYDSPGVNVEGAPRAALNGRFDVAFVLSEKNTKTGQVLPHKFYYRVTLVFDKGSIVGSYAAPISAVEFQRLTGSQ